MENALGLKDVVRFLELNKSRAELTFKMEVLKGDEEALERNRSNLLAVQKGIEQLTGRIERAGVMIAIPNEREIGRLNDILSGHSPAEILESMKSKEGEIFETLALRGKLIKKNYENRENIAKLALLGAKLQKEVRGSVVDSVRKGRIDESIPLLNTDGALAKKVAAILGRLGISATVQEGALIQSEGICEVEVSLQNRKKVWVAAEIHEKLSNNLDMITKISQKIQLKNAERQVRDFNEQEEKEFEDMQGEYLRLLKEQDGLLKDFLEEDKLSLMF